jgi:hypothetical protein
VILHIKPCHGHFSELFGDFAKEKISGGLDLSDLLKVSPVKYWTWLLYKYMDPNSIEYKVYAELCYGIQDPYTPVSFELLAAALIKPVSMPPPPTNYLGV